MKEFAVVLSIAVLLLAGCGRSDSPATWQEQYDLGVRYLSEDNYEEAIIAFTAAIEIDPKRAEAYEKLADTYVALGDSESAVDILRQGAEAIGDDTLFRDYIAELTAGAEQAPESSTESTSGPASSESLVDRTDIPGSGYLLHYHDETGNLTRYEEYDLDDTMRIYTLFYYDEVGNQTRSETYSPDGTMQDYDLRFYEAGHLTRIEAYMPDGTLVQISYYDATGNLARWTYYDPDGTPHEGDM